MNIQSSVFRNRWCVVIFAMVSAVIAYEYNWDSTGRWFRSDLPDPAIVAQWSPEELDQNLYKLSRWEGFNVTQFQSFVAHQIDGLRLNASDSFMFLEVGVGVGAFTREILRKFPNAQGIGFDLENKAVEIAKVVLPKSRMSVFVQDMTRFSAKPDSFDVILIPGSICYLHSLDDVLYVLSRLVRTLKPGGGLCASMIASLTSEMGSCNIRIPKRIWALKEMEIERLEQMNDWGLPHAMGRYSACLRKKR